MRCLAVSTFISFFIQLMYGDSLRVVYETIYEAEIINVFHSFPYGDANGYGLLNVADEIIKELSNLA